MIPYSYVYIYIYINIYTYITIYTYIHLYTYIYIYLHVYIEYNSCHEILRKPMRFAMKSDGVIFRLWRPELRFGDAHRVEARPSFPGTWPN